MTDSVGEYTQRQIELTYRYAYMRQAAVNLMLTQMEVDIPISDVELANTSEYLLRRIPADTRQWESFHAQLAAVAQDPDKLMAYAQCVRRENIVLQQLQQNGWDTQPPELQVDHYSTATYYA